MMAQQTLSTSRESIRLADGSLGEHYNDGLVRMSMKGLGRGGGIFNGYDLVLIIFLDQQAHDPFIFDELPISSFQAPHALGDPRSLESDFFARESLDYATLVLGNVNSCVFCQFLVSRCMGGAGSYDLDDLALE